MLNHIVAQLYQKGYRPLQEKEGGVLVREAGQQVYIVVLSLFREEVCAGDYERVQERTEFIAATRYKKPVQTLHLTVTKDDVFNERMMKLVEQFSNVWFMAADTGKIYIFENQTEKFDDLYYYLQKGLTEVKKSRRTDLTPVNTVIVALNILYFLVVIFTNGGYSAVYDTDIMLKMGAMSYQTFMNGAWYQIILSLFIHFGFSHLLNNMVLLIYVGCELEKRIGSLSYFILYLAAGICGNAASLWYYNKIGEVAVSAGASGAIFGVIGALFVVLVFNRSKTQNLTPRRLLFMSVITIYYGITTTGVDNAAHIGGVIGGIISGFLLSKISRYGKLK